MLLHWASGGFFGRPCVTAEPAVLYIFGKHAGAGAGAGTGAILAVPPLLEHDSEEWPEASRSYIYGLNISLDT